MLALLPDVGLQRALLRALKGDAAPRIPYVATPARCRGSNPPEWAKGVVASLQVCSFCGQVSLLMSTILKSGEAPEWGTLMHIFFSHLRCVNVQASVNTSK